MNESIYNQRLQNIAERKQRIGQTCSSSFVAFLFFLWVTDAALLILGLLACAGLFNPWCSAVLIAIFLLLTIACYYDWRNVRKRYRAIKTQYDKLYKEAQEVEQLLNWIKRDRSDSGVCS